MAKANWNDLLARFPQPHFLVAVVPDASEKESLFTAQSAQLLMVRLIKKLPTRGEFAVSVSRQSGQRKIIYAFGDRSDAVLVAKAIDASMSDSARHSFILDESAEQKLISIAGSGEPYRPYKGPAERWTDYPVVEDSLLKQCMSSSGGKMAFRF